MLSSRQIPLPWKKCWRFLNKFGRFCPPELGKHGGGHLITKRNYDRHHLIKLLIDFKNKYDIGIILEPGSALLINGYLVSTI